MIRFFLSFPDHSYSVISVAYGVGNEFAFGSSKTPTRRRCRVTIGGLATEGLDSTWAQSRVVKLDRRHSALEQVVVWEVLGGVPDSNDRVGEFVVTP